MRHHFREPVIDRDVAAPPACPVCRSKALITTSKTITSATYWRCTTCGEIWNVARRTSGSRYWPHQR